VAKSAAACPKKRRVGAAPAARAAMPQARESSSNPSSYGAVSTSGGRRCGLNLFISSVELLTEVLDQLSTDAHLGRVAAVCSCFRAVATALLRQRWDQGTRAVLCGRSSSAGLAFLRHWAQVAVGLQGQVLVACAGQARSCGQDWDGELCLDGSRQHWSSSWHPKLERVHGRLAAEDVVSVGCGRRHSGFVTRDGALFVSMYHIPGGVPTPVSIPGPVRDVVCANANDTTLALTRCGRVFEVRAHEVWVHEVVLPAKAACIGAGHHGCYAADVNGQLWAWSLPHWSNSLGGGAPAPVHAPGLRQVVQVSAGTGHSLAVTARGEMWAWGSDEHGQLGLGGCCRTRVAVPAPVRVRRLPPIVSAAAGTCHSVAASCDGRAYAWGHGDYVGHCGPNVALLTNCSASRGRPVRRDRFQRQLKRGQKPRPRRVGRRLLSAPGACCALSPQRIEALRGEPIVRVAAGHMGSVAVGRGGKLWSWGPMVTFGPTNAYRQQFQVQRLR
jgi:hypothetical protein